MTRVVYLRAERTIKRVGQKEEGYWRRFLPKWFGFGTMMNGGRWLASKPPTTSQTCG